MQKRCRSSLLSLFLLAALFLAGCGPTPSLVPMVLPSNPPLPTPTPAPTVTPPAYLTLTVWHSWDEAEQALVRSLLADYQAQHPGLTVRLRRVAVERIVADYEEAVLTGEGPDLLVGRSHWIGRLVEGKSIAPLDEAIDQDYWSHFYPFALGGVQLAERRYAVPYAAETVALYYNRAFVGSPPTTTARMLDLAATWPGQDQAGLAFPLSYYNTVGYLYAWGGRLLDEEGRPALESVETRTWLEWLQQVRESPGVIAADSYGQADARFKAGAVAMVVNGSWALPDYTRALGTDLLGVVPLPMLDRTQAWPTPYVGYHVLMVNPAALAVHPRETVELLEFLGGPQYQSLRAQQLQRIPTWAEIDLSSSPLLAAFVAQAQFGRPRPVTTAEQACWDPLEQLLYNVAGRRVPADQALRQTQQRIEQVLQELGGSAP